MTLMQHYRKKLSLWLLPYVCLLCGNLSNRSQDLCTLCLADLPTITNPCPQCAKPLPKDTVICPFCLTDPPLQNQTRALFLYQNPITQLIMNLKFGHNLAISRIFGELLVDQIKNYWYRTCPMPEIIVPIPLHASRLKERGFNQAVEIARPIAKALHCPLEINHCERIKETRPQTTLPAGDRLKNIQNAFSINGDFPYQHVAVIDDVITTGNTLKEFCRILQKKGVKKIDVWCCARAILLKSP